MTVRFLRWFFPRPTHPGWVIALGLGLAGCGVALSVRSGEWEAYVIAALGSFQVVMALVLLKIRKRED